MPDGEVGYVVAPEPKAIATAVARFFTSGEGEVFSRNIRHYKKKFSWEHFVKSIWDMAAKL